MATGRQLPEETIPLLLPKVAIPIDEDERLRRWRFSRPDPEWHVQRQRELQQEGNTDAATLHRSFEQRARGRLAMETGDFNQAYAHFLSAALVLLPKSDK